MKKIKFSASQTLTRFKMNILSEQLARVKLSEKEKETLEQEAKTIVDSIKKSGKMDVFIGGSMAKKTIMKKESYDVDIFVRFEKDGEISENLDKILKKTKLNYERVHGSRDYFRIKHGKIIFEIIPVMKIKKPEEARNVTDLSYFHVSYVLGKIKKKPKLSDEILLAKSFCHAQRCYGAESYVRGFSGYALELLIIHYGSFLKFIKEMTKAQKTIIDMEKKYKNKQDILLNLNESKLQSPVVIVDPTFRERNALAALSNETFSKFKKTCVDFLKKPSLKFFDIQKVDPRKFNLIIEVKTDKQEGDIAGSKLLKFFNFMSREIDNLFIIQKKDFDYNISGKFYFKLKKRTEIIREGPPVNKLENLVNFKAAHKNVFIKNGKAYAKDKISITPEKMISNFIQKEKRIIDEMGITEIKIIS